MMSENKNSNDMNNNIIHQSHILNTVLPVIDNDIETGNGKKNINNQYILKGILKKSNDVEDDNRTNLFILKMCLTLAIIIITTPLIICDIYIGFTDNSCINEIPNGFNYTMKLYLLVSGFMGAGFLIILIYTTCSLSLHDEYNESKLFCIKCIGLVE